MLHLQQQLEAARGAELDARAECERLKAEVGGECERLRLDNSSLRASERSLHVRRRPKDPKPKPTRGGARQWLGGRMVGCDWVLGGGMVGFEMLAHVGGPIVLVDG